MGHNPAYVIETFYSYGTAPESLTQIWAMSAGHQILINILSYYPLLFLKVMAVSVEIFIVIKIIRSLFVLSVNLTHQSIYHAALKNLSYYNLICNIELK
jgi:hypothetical protein